MKITVKLGKNVIEIIKQISTGCPICENDINRVLLSNLVHCNSFGDIQKGEDMSRIMKYKVVQKIEIHLLKKNNGL